MKASAFLFAAVFSSPVVTAFAAPPDYSKRAAAIDDSLRSALVGRWTNPVDRLIISFDSIDPLSGKIEGTVTPVTGPAAANAHELIGWVNAAPAKPDADNVTPVTFSTTLYEYGTLPAWSGYLKDGKLVTMHYLVWPNKTYSWDHISAFQETWTRLP